MYLCEDFYGTQLNEVVCFGANVLTGILVWGRATLNEE